MDVFDLAVHPAAEVFPMLDSDELSELAADIAENGLREPLVLGPSPDGEVWLVDGRNRREACRLAEVEPETRMLNGEDQAAYIISANINRRHMTKGARAMAVAKIFPEPKRGRGNVDPARKDAEAASIRYRAVQMARTVLNHAASAADAVLAGARSLDDAYAEAREAKAANDDAQAALTEVRERYPSLAESVVEGNLSLKAAMVEARERDEARARQLSERKRAASAFVQAAKVLEHAGSWDDDVAEEWPGVVEAARRVLEVRS